MEWSVRRFSDIAGPPQGAYHERMLSSIYFQRVRKAAAAAEAVEASISAVEIPTQQRKIAIRVDIAYRQHNYNYQGHHYLPLRMLSSSTASVLPTNQLSGNGVERPYWMFRIPGVMGGV